ncbi:MAG: hypothetical protein NTX17_00940 [Candidatus Eisenbacteria bacterium]|nr:hypothetical protein [Candidatus Eisenbacteria bacterium]
MRQLPSPGTLSTEDEATLTLPGAQEGSRTHWGIIIWTIVIAISVVVFAPRLIRIVNNTAQEERSDVTADYLLLFEDHFDKDVDLWPICKTESHTAKIAKGKYVFEYRLEDEGVMHATSIKGFDLHKNFVIEAVFTKISGTDERGFGITWGGKDGGNYYEAKIAGNGCFSYAEMKKGTQSLITGRIITESINRENSTNKLTVKKVGRQLHFFVNDQHVINAPSKPLFGHQLGFVLDGKMKVEIDYISVRQIS